jgi:hypothetical protein
MVQLGRSRHLPYRVRGRGAAAHPARRPRGLQGRVACVVLASATQTFAQPSRPHLSCALASYLARRRRWPTPGRASAAAALHLDSREFARPAHARARTAASAVRLRAPARYRAALRAQLADLQTHDGGAHASPSLQGARDACRRRHRLGLRGVLAPCWHRARTAWLRFVSRQAQRAPRDAPYLCCHRDARAAQIKLLLLQPCMLPRDRR